MSFQKLQRISNAFLTQHQIFRTYAFKSDLKIKWVRPEKIPCYKPEKSGDCGKMSNIDPKLYIGEYGKSQELQSADPKIQSLFQIQNNPSRFTKHHHRTDLIKKVQRHSLDYGSMEAKLAKMTGTIHYYQQHMEKHPRDVKVKVDLKELIDKRKKFLKYLRRWDYRRFEWILEKLDLIYKPPPNEFHWITRKESLQKLTNIYCDNLKEERLQAYREKLDAEKIPFLQDAIQKMERARKDQIEWDLKEYVTEAQIKEARELLESLYAERAAAAVNAANTTSNENVQS